MQRKDAEQLTRIYNTLLTVKTSGEDTIVMGTCLNAFKVFMSHLEIVENKNPEEVN